ncbi:MAG: NAD(P)-dependent oxidoreductase [Actinomycetota bacterium]|nr:NAD(P)-dependent oxidoreductase [Actinomycetota bacterium]
MISVGVIGLGAMGSAVAERYLACGGSVTVWNRSPGPTLPLRALGARIAGSLVELAGAADLILTLLPTGDEVSDVLVGAGGVIAAAKLGSLIIDCSTIDPEVSRRVAAEATVRNVRFADAGLGGLPADAKAGQLSVMYGTLTQDAGQVEAALGPVAKQFAHCGGHGAGVTTKVISNLLSNAIHVANLEAIVLGERAGLDTAILLKVLESTAADNRQLRQRVPAELLERHHRPGFKIDLAYKDVGIGCGLAIKMGVPLTVLASGVGLLAAARTRGRGQLAVTALLPTLRESVAPPRDSSDRCPSRAAHSDTPPNSEGR